MLEDLWIVVSIYLILELMVDYVGGKETKQKTGLSKYRIYVKIGSIKRKGMKMETKDVKCMLLYIL